MFESWLVKVAKEVGLEGAADLEIDARTPPDEAWEAVSRACDVNQEELVGHVAASLRVDVADLDSAEPQALKLVPEKLARRYLVYPLREDDSTVVVATSNPTDLEVEQAIGFASGRNVVFEVAAAAEIRQKIEHEYSPERDMEMLLRGLDTDASTVQVEEELGPTEVTDEQAQAEPIVQLTSVILAEATKAGASDIHFEPGPHGGTVRFRVDGVMRHSMRIPMMALNGAISRIKVLAKLDIADRLRPQDGHLRIRIGNAVYDLRISTVPTRDAEKLVVRVLDPKGVQRLDDLMMPGPEYQRLRQLLAHREGIVLVTGPTGSGKTTTLYAALAELATGEVNIMTVENPVEYEMPGITQIQIAPKRGVTFASALRAILRQDPDIILVGEIRDAETAEVAAQASMTGHLVLATLHTNDAVGIVERLRDLGLDLATIAATVRGSLAQRLVRRVCDNCVEPVEDRLSVDEQRLAERYGVDPNIRAVGCSRCGGTGYRGRLSILEVLTADRKMVELIAQGTTATRLERAAVAGGMRPLHEVAAERVSEGLTTLTEIDRVLGELVADQASPSAVEPHVLVVDDDAGNRFAARRILKKAGFRVSEAEDGVDALEKIESGEDYALVVLDLDMPRLDGRGVLDRVRGSVATSGLPVVVLTGLEAKETEVQLMESGADDYIRKPIDPPRFVARVRATLRRAGM